MTNKKIVALFFFLVASVARAEARVGHFNYVELKDGATGNVIVFTGLEVVRCDAIKHVGPRGQVDHLVERRLRVSRNLFRHRTIVHSRHKSSK